MLEKEVTNNEEKAILKLTVINWNSKYQYELIFKYMYADKYRNKIYVCICTSHLYTYFLALFIERVKK